MARIYTGRYTASLDGDFVVFLIGMRVNKLWKIHKWLPVAREMGPMLKTLFSNPEKGMLGARFGWMGGPMVVEYWRSFADLDRFAGVPPILTAPPGGGSTRKLEPREMSGSGTRPSRCVVGISNASTTTCPG